MSARVTVVIGTFQRAHLLSRAIRSVLSQTYQDIILSIFDNASNDHTEQIVERFANQDSRVRYHRHATNLGSSENYLFGMRSIETEFFSLLSDDDLMFPAFIQNAVSALEKYPGAKFAAGSTLEFTDKGEFLHSTAARWRREGVFHPREGSEALLHGRHPSWTTILFRREIIDSIGYFDADIVQVCDLEYTLRAASRFPFVFFNNPSGIFVRHPASGTEFTDLGLIPQFQAMIDRLCSATDIEPSIIKCLRIGLTYDLGQRILQIAAKALIRKDRKAAREALVEHQALFKPTILSWILRATLAMSKIPGFFYVVSFGAKLRERLVALRSQLTTPQRDLSRYASYLRE